MANEMRLIDANALIRRLCAERDDVKIEHACDIGYHNGLNMAVSMTINAPTVDAIVLPCGYGKTVYAVGSKKIVECEIDEISFGVVGLMYLVSFDCDNDCDGCPFNSWKQDYSGEWSCDGEYNQSAVKGCEFGKTVFLTRKEAEAALAKMDG